MMGLPRKFTGDLKERLVVAPLDVVPVRWTGTVGWVGVCSERVDDGCEGGRASNVAVVPS